MMTEPDSAPLPPPEMEALSTCLRQRTDADLETFLSNVDEVSTLISKLASADTPAEMDRLRDDADQFIAKFAQSADKPVRINGGGEGDDDDGGCGCGGAIAEQDYLLKLGIKGDEIELHEDPTKRSNSPSSGSVSDDDAQLRGLLDAKIAAACPKGVLKALEEMEGREEARRVVLECMDRIDGRVVEGEEYDNGDDGDLAGSIVIDWRERGNHAFKKENYELAVHCYSLGLESKRDCTALWTNRAQALIKVERFEDALIDCAAAIAICGDCLKAYVHRGRAHLGLKKFDKAEAAFREVLRIDPKQQKCVKMYLKQVADDRDGNNSRKESEEAVRGSEARNGKIEGGTTNCKRGLSDGVVTADDPDLSGQRSSSQQREPVKIKRKIKQSIEPARYSSDVTETLRMMQVPDQKPDYYLSGLKILVLELVDMTTTTVFRALDGFDLLLTDKHPVIYAALKKPFNELSPIEMELHDALFKVLSAACHRNVDNQRKCVSTGLLTRAVLKVLALPFPSPSKESALRLLHLLVDSELGRDAVVAKFDGARLLTALFSSACDGRKQAGVTSAVFATMLFTRLAPDKRFKVGMRDKFADLVLPAFEALVQFSFRGDYVDDDEDDKDALEITEFVSKTGISSASSSSSLPSPEDVAVIPSSFAVMAVLATDPFLRSQLAGHFTLWELSLDLLGKSFARLRSEQPYGSVGGNPAVNEATNNAVNDNRYVHKMILHMLGFLINISQEDSPHRLKFAPEICSFCVQLLKHQEPKSLWHSKSFLTPSSSFASSPSSPSPSASAASSSSVIDSKRSSENGSFTANTAVSTATSLSNIESASNGVKSSPSNGAKNGLNGALKTKQSESNGAFPSKSPPTNAAISPSLLFSTATPDDSMASLAELMKVESTCNPSKVNAQSVPASQSGNSLSTTTKTSSVDSPKAASSTGKKDAMPLEEEPHESTRALVLLSLLLPQNDKFVEDLVSSNGIGPLISFIQYGTKNQVKASVKVTAVCAQQCPAARDDIISCRKALPTIVLLLKNEDEHVIGNAALCLTHCIEIPKVPEKLTKTNVVKHLLVLARDARKIGVQENCAILLAKLAMKENRHLQRLRELHGIEILHTCMKHIKT